ncbi:hypothetical protein VIM7927_02871 [Vibrio mangrovi]|nr:hypothetical protein VIM7927_02871 [Vibrio mangrovi]
MTLIEGRVKSCQAVTQNAVRIELEGSQTVIRLTLSEPWVLEDGDLVAVSGLQDPESDVFLGYGYVNQSKNIKASMRSNGMPFILFGGVLTVITLCILAFIFSGDGYIHLSDFILAIPPFLVLLFSTFFIKVGVKAKRKEKAVRRMLNEVQLMKK